MTDLTVEELRHMIARSEYNEGTPDLIKVSEQCIREMGRADAAQKRFEASSENAVDFGVSLSEIRDFGLANPGCGHSCAKMAQRTLMKGENDEATQQGES